MIISQNISEEARRVLPLPRFARGFHRLGERSFHLPAQRDEQDRAGFTSYLGREGRLKTKIKHYPLTSGKTRYDDREASAGRPYPVPGLREATRQATREID